jgi:hypothetical protein
MRCACGNRTFVERLVVSREARAERWRSVGETELYMGAGVTPMGTGAGGATFAGQRAWVRRDATVIIGARQTRCAACGRVRRSRELGGGAPLELWVEGPTLFMLVSDAVDVGCLVARFTSATRAVFDRSLLRTRVDPPAPDDVAGAVTILPENAVTTNVVYAVALPTVAGSYALKLVDRCLRITQSVATLDVDANGVASNVLLQRG